MAKSTNQLAEHEPLLAVNGLEVTFRTPNGPVRVVEELTFTAGRKERLAIVGESGSGKSVTALAILGLLPQPAGAISAGNVEFDGVELTSLTSRQMQDIRGARIGMIFQDAMASLNPLITIGGHITEPLVRHRGMSRPDAKKRAVELVEMVQLPRAAECLGKYPHEFSGGMRQRIMIAAALACEPDLLIADEPTTALDVTVQAGVLDLLSSLSEELGTSVIMITHDLGVVAQFAERVMVMYAGRAVEHSVAQKLFEAPGHPYSRDLLASIPRVDAPRGHRLPAIPGQLPTPGDRPEGCNYTLRCSSAMEVCVAHQPPWYSTQGGVAACWLQDPDQQAELHIARRGGE